MLPLLRGVCHLGQAHLRHGHLRDVDQYLQITARATAAMTVEERCDVVGGQLGLFGDREKGSLVGPHKCLQSYNS